MMSPGWHAVLVDVGIPVALVLASAVLAFVIWCVRVVWTLFWSQFR